MKRLLWLDDIRNPKDKIWTDWMRDADISMLEYDIIWVKSYDEFCTWLTLNGLPDMICFDHDLGLDEVHEKKTMSKSALKRFRKTPEYKTGFDCAKWLIEFCLDNLVNPPDYKIQSSNPVGAENIKGLIENFRKNVKF